MTKLAALVVFLALLHSCNNVNNNATTSNNGNDSIITNNMVSNPNLCIDRPPIEYFEEDTGKLAGGLRSKIWSNLPHNASGQQIINVRFLNGSAFLKNKVVQYAKQWEPFANVEFRFFDLSNDPIENPEIKVAFQAGNGSWSFIGNDSKINSPSMNFGWFNNSTAEMEFSRVILHEFGHALGLIHEHQNPRDNPIRLNRDSVIKMFSGPPNFWSPKEIEDNVIKKYSIDQINGSAFDPNSIMIYGFPASMTLNGKGTKDNFVLSVMDKKVMKALYKNH